ncbi:hypothetical protein JI735_00300 [Paenibacillus sonchi]|uniref:Uncharacterized protein n=1 Tax=Paenibacillus sonchi TaxID=373687 RepID=A0A974PD94_9BACL|nr:hypothetical protein [Paenibacillus sonchi]QQZ61298.1 hypothetical protein JI735_00300 [Paenibacillus sonchi]
MNRTAATTRLGDKVLAYSELKNDLLFHKIPKDKMIYYIEQPLAIGTAKAGEYKAKFGTDIQAICRNRGIKVVMNERSGKLGQIRFRAQIELSAEERVITLYKSSMEELQQCAGVLLPGRAFSLEEIMDIHLAHELFHDLEFSEIGYTNERLDYISSLSLGPFRIRASVTKTSEIAAHAFSRHLLGLPYLPNLLDYAHMIHSGALSREDFWKLVEDWSAELDNYC